MINGIYICSGIDFDSKSSGITNKIKKQIKVLQTIGKVDLICINNNLKRKVDKIKFILPFFYSSYEKRMIGIKSSKEINWNQICYVYIRRITFCKGFIDMLRDIKKNNPNILILMEIPTYPLNGEYRGMKKIMRYFNNYYTKKMYKYVDYIITYSKDNKIWGIKTVQISNAIDFEEITEKIFYQSKSLNLIAVAKFNFWHGYDRVIKGLKEYYQNNKRNLSVFLYLVGDGKVLSKYKKLVREYHLEEYVIFTGPKYGVELDELYNKCQIALDAMGRHRSKVYYNSSLKGKEYGAKGMPIISGVKTEIDFYPNFEYYYRVPANDASIDIEKIIDFYNKINIRPAEEIIKEIRSFNRKNLIT